MKNISKVKFNDPSTNNQNENLNDLNFKLKTLSLSYNFHERVVIEKLKIRKNNLNSYLFKKKIYNE